MAGISAAQGGSLLESGDFSDFLITCQGSQYRCHRNILACVSDFFRATFTHSFKESNEAKIDLPDDDPETIKSTLHYIYTGQYEIQPPEIFHAALSSQNETGVPEVLPKIESTENDILRKTVEVKAHAMVYCCADKYGVAVLKDLAQARFIEGAGRAKIHLDFDLLTFVFENTRREGLGLRAHAIKACIEKHGELRGNQKLVSLLIKHEPLIWEVGSGLQARIGAKEAAVKEVETQRRTKERDILQLSARCDLLEASIVEQKAKASEELKTVKIKSSIMVAKVLEDTRAAKADTASEVAYANKLLDYMKNARFCEHCGKRDQLQDPVRKWNEELEKEQYFLQCNSCGWWWFFQDKQPKPVTPKE